MVYLDDPNCHDTALGAQDHNRRSILANPIHLGAFVHDAPTNRVVFGVGAIHRLGEELERLGVSRALVLATPRRHGTDAALAAAGDRATGVFAEAAMHVPVAVAERGLKAALDGKADCTIAVGGGSTIGLAKAIAHQSGLPILAVPTTYSGSEMTPIYGLTGEAGKITGKDPRVLPKTVIYDSGLTMDLPPEVSGPSGMNALAHAVEATYAEGANPLLTLLSLEAIRVLASALPRVIEQPQDLDARSEALYAAWLAGFVLNAGIGIHHKLCHILGGTFGLPHAETHTVVLPHAVAFNREAAPDALGAVQKALQAENAAQAIYDLAVRVGAPTSLKDLKMPSDGLDRAAMLATESEYYNPRPVEQVAVRQLLEDAYYGRRPV